MKAKIIQVILKKFLLFIEFTRQFTVSYNCKSHKYMNIFSLCFLLAYVIMISAIIHGMRSIFSSEQPNKISVIITFDRKEH